MDVHSVVLCGTQGRRRDDLNARQITVTHKRVDDADAVARVRVRDGGTARTVAVTDAREKVTDGVAQHHPALRHGWCGIGAEGDD